MLQAALLLLGCALSKYLWEVDTTVASVVLGVTSFGVLFYLFTVAAGSTSDSCPYQTPTTNTLRRVPRLLRPAYALFVNHSDMHGSSIAWWSGVSRLPVSQIIWNILVYPFVLLIAFTADVVKVARLAFRSLANFARRARVWPFGTRLLPGQALEDRATRLDLRCLSWILQTSSDKTTKASALYFLGTILPRGGLNSPVNSAIVVDCFNILCSCFVILDGGVTVVTRGSEWLAAISAMCFLGSFSSLSVADPTSLVIRDVRQRYERAFPPRVNFRGLPHPVIMSAIYNLFTGPQDRMEIDWRSYEPQIDELVPFSRALAQAAQFEYHRGGARPEVPRWLIQFALRFLSLDPLPPTSVVVDCLTIIATDLGCTIIDTHGTASNERPVSTSEMIFSR